MINFFESNLEQLSIHYVGNKTLDQGMYCSDEPVKLDDETKLVLFQFLSASFERSDVLFHFSAQHKSNIVYEIVRSMFSGDAQFIEGSKNLARHLYDSSSHPKVSGGHFYVAKYKNVYFEGGFREAIGLFRHPSDPSTVSIKKTGNGFEMDLQTDVISSNSPKLGCLIIKTEENNGYVVALSGKDSIKSAPFKDEFLNLDVRKDNYAKSSNMMQAASLFIKSEIDHLYKVSAVQKTELLSRANSYFKTNYYFDINDFAGEVFRDNDVNEDFRQFITRYEDQHQIGLGDQFDISDQAVKKGAKSFKKVIKLDRNFHLYVHGSHELIERGFDADKDMNFYKVYFKNEE